MNYNWAGENNQPCFLLKYLYLFKIFIKDRMRISSFISSDFFSLPKTRPENQDFKTYVKGTLDDFLNKLNELAKTNDYFEDISEFTLESIIRRQKHLIRQINTAIDYYYNGKPASALNSLNRGLKSKEKNFAYLMYEKRFLPETSFYRIRKHKENFPLAADKFFHIPFELRGKVKTQRYSIPGFPSLYLGNTVYVCWEELGRPNINDFQVVRLKNIDSIYVLNLVPPTEEHITPKRRYSYLMLWPLIFSTSIKVNKQDDTFKPEYIIPQLLLQWVRNKEDIDGIVYQTTHIDLNKTKSKGEFHNIVLPVKENNTKGLCQQLKSKFEMTAATSIQLNELISGNVIDGGSEDESNVDEKIQMLEIIKGQVFPYSYSKLGKMESILMKMETKPF